MGELTGSERCAAWARYVTHGGGAPAAEVQGVQILADLQEYLLVEQVLKKQEKETGRPVDRMRKLLLWAHKEGEPCGDFILFDGSDGFPFELKEIGLDLLEIVMKALGDFYKVVEGIAARLGEKCDACGGPAKGTDPSAGKRVCRGCGYALTALGERIEWDGGLI